MRRRELISALVILVSWTPAARTADDAPDPSASVRATTPEPATATENPRATTGRAIEEIIVTAQKKQENVQQVPISISVVGNDFMQQQAITDFRELALYVPNAHVDPGSGLFPDINIRGFGTALSNKAFEQSVGLAIDGVPYGTTPYFDGAFFDVNRVEVLRGPQGTLFGKNTTAGLFNVVTNRPTDQYSGFVVGEVGDLGRRHFEAGIGGPVVRGLLNFRLAAISDERDGIVENTTAEFVSDANPRMNDRDRKAIRAELALPDLAGAHLLLSYEHFQSHERGVGWEFTIVPQKVRPFYMQFDPKTDFQPDNFVGSVDTPEFNRDDIDTFVTNADYELGDWRLDATAGYSLLKVRALSDDDFGPAPMLVDKNRDDDPQTTVELRVSSPSLPGFFGIERLFGLRLGSTDFIAGFFYQRRAIENSRLEIDINLPVEAEFLAVNNAPAGTPLPSLQQFIGPSVPIGNLGLFDTRSLTAAEIGEFSQTTNSYAGFGQANWHLAERWTLESGMRVTEERKDGSWHRTFSPGTGLAFVALGGAEFTTSRSRSEFAFTPKVTLRYDWSSDISAYAGWGKGFKAGGFNEQAFQNSTPSLQFEPEKDTSWELGAKLRLLDGSAVLNVALFRMDVTDLQVLTLPPNSVNTTVVNAGEARSQGVEVDSTWLPTSWLTIVGALGFIDAEYVKFPLGQCAFDRPDTDGNGDGRCDLSGQRLFRTPPWKITVVPSVRFPLTTFLPGSARLPNWLAGVDWIAGLTVEYQDVQVLTRSDDLRGRQPSFFRLGGNVGFGNPAQGWSLRVVGENLNDVATHAYIQDVPLGGGNFAGIPEPPRLVFGSFRWAF